MIINPNRIDVACCQVFSDTFVSTRHIHLLFVFIMEFKCGFDLYFLEIY